MNFWEVLGNIIDHKFFIAVVAPIVSGFVLAYVYKWMEERKSRRDVLMNIAATRGDILSDSHVNFVNLIPLVFNRKKKDAKIRKAFSTYMRHLGKEVIEAEAALNHRMEAEGLLNDLIFEISQVLKVQFDRLSLDLAYQPRIAQTKSHLLSLGLEALQAHLDKKKKKEDKKKE